MIHFKDEILIQKLQEIGQEASFEDGDIVVDIGEQLNFLPITLEGRLDIYIDREDREGFLYSVPQEDMCAIGLKCCLNSRTSVVRAYAQGNTRLLMIPVDQIYPLCQLSEEWFRFVIEKLNDRIQELMEQLDHTIFGDLSDRLLAYLKKKTVFYQSNHIKITHSEIARDLNSSREVVTRLLHSLEQKALLKTSRGQIELLMR